MIFGFIKSTFLIRIAKKISLILICVQIASILLMAFQIPEQPSWKEYYSNDQNKFVFSTKKNVIVLLLDTYQTDVFQEVIDEDPTYKDIFNGFTYFRNVTGGFPTTYPSIPLILTGQYYDNSIPIQTFIRKAFQTSSISRKLLQQGYDVYLPAEPWAYCDNQIATNYVKKKFALYNPATYHELQKGAISLYEYSLFRYLPHFFKEYIYNNRKGLRKILKEELFLDKAGKHSDVVFIDKMVSKSKVGMNKDVFKFYHQMGLHPPFRLNENLQYTMLEDNRTGVKHLARAELKLTKMFLDKLTALGVYNNSMILVLADHGLSYSVKNIFPEKTAKHYPAR